MRYRWATPEDGRRFLGWIVAAVVGGALEWRPHLMLTAPERQCTGKTWLMTDVIETDNGSVDQKAWSDATVPPPYVASVRTLASP